MPNKNYDEFVLMLHELIGMNGHYSGEEYQLVEIIDHPDASSTTKRGPEIVLVPADADRIIQDSMFGEARRKVDATFTVAALSDIKTKQLHPAFAEFVGNEIQRMLEASLPT